MEFNVINGEFSVTSIKITFLSTGSILMVGDVQSITLSSFFEGPPEKIIVGVTIPVAPLVLPTIE